MATQERKCIFNVVSTYISTEGKKRKVIPLLWELSMKESQK